MLRFVISDSVNPYENIALEESLLLHTKPGEVILYLWQNRKTVVIGYNQNAWKECRVETLTADGGYLARRLSGGGAVFHDLGNLNFTFLARRKDYDVARQTEVVLRAVRSFGIPAVCTGRNDLEVEGRKFSGNAFYRTGDFCYHHGTVLLNADRQEMTRYLSVSQEKLRSKGVESVKSRVGNLQDYVPSLTVEQMGRALIAAFGDVYGERPERMAIEELSAKELRERTEHFSSWEWLYGRKIPFNMERAGKFGWGEALLRLDVSEGIIRQASFWTDALDTEMPGRVSRALGGCRYESDKIRAALMQIPRENESQEQMIRDLAGKLLGEQDNEMGGDDERSI